MKRTFLWIACLLALALDVSAQQRSTYSLSRESYEDRISQQLRQLRQQIDVAARAAPLAGQSRYAPLYDALATAESSFGELKTSSEINLATRRQACEAAVAKATRLWSDFRLSPPADAPENP